MAHRRFFCSRLNSRVFLDGDEFHHMFKVMRVKTGEEVELYDAAGGVGRGRVTAFEPGRAVIELEDLSSFPRPEPGVIVAAALLKSALMDWLVEKLCEMGVDEIRPIVYTRTEIKAGESMLQRWQRIARQTLKVNHRHWATEVFPPQGLVSFLESCPGHSAGYFLDLAGSEPLRPPFPGPVLVLIGPPGDFTQEERSRLLQAEFLPRRINDAVLKSETAALAATAILKNG